MKLLYKMCKTILLFILANFYINFSIKYFFIKYYLLLNKLLIIMKTKYALSHPCSYIYKKKNWIQQGTTLPNT
jgi:hypothetical protein